jgi:surfeit locus 1 family protein
MSLRMKAFGVFVLLMTLAELGLGLWQWQRLGEKNAMIAGIEAAAKAAPKPLADAQIWDKVTLTGRFLNDKSAYVRSSRPEPKPGARTAAGAVPASGFGVLVLTPFVTRTCTPAGKCTLITIYVNRGFVATPPSGRIPAFDRPEETVTLTGFLRPSEKPTLFQPGNDPARGVFFHRTIEEMAKKAGLFNAENSAASPYHRFVDREARAEDNAAPHGIEITDFLQAIPNNHFQYALTWWALALTNMIVALFFVVGRRRQQGAAA